MNETFDPWGDPATREHDSIQLNLAVCAVLTWLISAVFVGLRVYTRRFLLKVFGWEDTCIILSLIFAGAMTAGALDQIVHGSGKHAWDIPAGNYTPLARANWYTVLFYFLSLAFCKLSILFLYHGIFTYQSVHIAVYVVAAIVIVTNVWNVIATLTACIPLRAYWDVRAMPGARCWDASVWWTNLSLHMGTDWLIFLMPLPVIWRLTVPRRQKFILVGVFALGFFVCFVSVFRLVSLIQAQKEMSHDFSYHNANLGYWTSVEVSFAIVCACLMTLKPLVSRFFPSFFSPTPVHSVHSQGGSTTAGGGASSTRQMRLRSKFSSPLDSPLYGGRGGLRREFGRPHHYNEQSAQERGLESWFDDDDARLSQDDGRRGARHSRRMSIEEIPMDSRDTDRSREEAAAAQFRDGVDSPSDTIPRASLRPPPPVVRTQSRDGPGGTFLASLSDAGGRSPSVLPPPSPAGSVGGSTFGGSKAEFYDSSSEKTSQEFGTVTSTTATTTTTPAETFGRRR